MLRPVQLRASYRPGLEGIYDVTYADPLGISKPARTDRTVGSQITVSDGEFPAASIAVLQELTLGAEWFMGERGTRMTTAGDLHGKVGIVFIAGGVELLTQFSGCSADEAGRHLGPHRIEASFPAKGGKTG